MRGWIVLNLAFPSVTFRPQSEKSRIYGCTAADLHGMEVHGKYILYGNIRKRAEGRKEGIQGERIEQEDLGGRYTSIHRN